MRALDDAMAAQVASLAERQHGVVALAEIRTLLEEVIYEACADHSLPPPLVNVPIGDHTLDFLRPQALLVVEAGGGDHLTQRQGEKDNARDADLGRAGHFVRRPGWWTARDRAGGGGGS